MPPFIVTAITWLANSGLLGEVLGKLVNDWLHPPTPAAIEQQSREEQADGARDQVNAAGDAAVADELSKWTRPK